MTHIIAFLIILAIKIIKWVIVKTRLYIVVLPVMIVLIFFGEWYDAHTILSDSIGIVLVVGVIISWIITLIKYIKVRKHNNELMLKWIY